MNRLFSLTSPVGESRRGAHMVEDLRGAIRFGAGRRRKGVRGFVAVNEERAAGGSPDRQEHVHG
jgi:hypothetical protein